MTQLHRIDHDGMTFHLGIPDYPLNLWVDHYLLASGQARFQQKRVFPNNKVDIFFNLGDINRGRLDQEAAEFEFRQIILSGLRSSFMHVHPGGFFNIAGLRFRLFGFTDLFGIPASEIANHNLALADVLGSDVLHLHERLAATPDARQRLFLLEQWLLAKVATRSSDTDIRIWNKIELRFRRQEVCSRSNLEVLLGYSYKHSLKLFTHRAGLHPKTVERIYRFNSLLQALTSPSAEGLAALAYRFGFSDQSHMIREFRQYTGFTPGQFLQQTKVFTEDHLRPRG